MKYLTLQTTHGPIHFVGRIWAEDARPALVAMSGAFPPEAFLHELVDWFRGINVLVAPIPGMSGTATRDYDLGRVSAALDEAIQRLLPGSPIVAFGVSAGSLVTLNLRAPGIVRHVVVEPFFRTGPLWPLHATLRKGMADAPAAWRLAALEIFGLSENGLEERDYRAVLERLAVPADVALADDPLEPEREVARSPSLTSAEDRALLEAHPLVTLHKGPAGSGHDLFAAPEGPAMIRELLISRLRPLADGHAERRRSP